MLICKFGIIEYRRTFYLQNIFLWNLYNHTLAYKNPKVGNGIYLLLNEWMKNWIWPKKKQWINYQSRFMLSYSQFICFSCRMLRKIKGKVCSANVPRHSTRMPACLSFKGTKFSLNLYQSFLFVICLIFDRIMFNLLKLLVFISHCLGRGRTWVIKTCIIMFLFGTNQNYYFLNITVKNVDTVYL